MGGVSADEAMRRAIALAARGLGTTSPNPLVGCVLLDPNGEIVGEGFHAYAGGPHAEIVALAQAGERARGGTAVVTLEPCDHTGRTGPCSGALISAGVRRVVVGVPDPNPIATGGIERLRAAGVEVEVGVRAAEAEAGNLAWLTAVRRRRPYLIWKYAATLDGRIAAADGTSMWITSEAARIDVHALRGTVDAVIAGVGTVLADDPRLTARNLRDGTLAIRQPLRVVVDSAGRTPSDARVRDGAAPTWVATAKEVGAGPDGHVDLPRLLAELYRRGVRAALLEGGPTLAGAFLAAGLVDKVVGYLAPKLLGAGPAALGDAGARSISEVIDLEFTDVTPVGPDLRVTAFPRKTEG
ncbi:MULTISPECIES: bifunctional diaminohydroxyphosphoribosylaminopyrimidine deaminase/5-amino-6-(5-phosphoribosylamino)uracil reductase RibD [unclassified Plantactinospora]|uniref:bifunctional diaminohydroxyphosphoribosylaminopyrimidine deaminase/5-amino-6-(5-phosphoribosylamino)uracil reductase RibD n=1 Tax=unclassified Plantactinospora TaxID=2631981 RepID=UPI000D15743A|nr:MULTISPECIES: bifunctional diaminohydroxyphosphoribosylaminopyrimidine deaminase/5-amino-6-(5-phosphoribosylamino)uracil reductase RibD [unclassified Plantactinospora]AVT31873.1 bifunctional diaminohydroxyphosphoribosylaminopyrimidine deaminase/5-amino-6-(5-phosphoribosylamino)uracil reductase RibD [Plantactinospora sp. BC1]AVT40303.1 bifunctional diaminohydroxyphosphoribosylaminopyrimidine deaminase/5-amino-6-(5-phosphoribosylamino)uracil reductase RibD [Plantactinospora sp. BB1]